MKGPLLTQIETVSVQGVVFTASEMAALLWQTQDNPEDIGEYAANQQQRALSAIVTDVLGVLAGLDHISTDARADGCAPQCLPHRQPLRNDANLRSTILGRLYARATSALLLAVPLTHDIPLHLVPDENCLCSNRFNSNDKNGQFSN